MWAGAMEQRVGCLSCKQLTQVSFIPISHLVPIRSTKRCSPQTKENKQTKKEMEVIKKQR